MHYSTEKSQKDDEYLICMISLYTNMFLLVLTAIFMFFSRLPWMFAFIYGVLGNMTFRREFEFEFVVIVGCDFRVDNHFGNVVGCVYMLWGLIWFLGIQSIIFELRRMKKTRNTYV